jgi:hypothetical protein
VINFRNTSNAITNVINIDKNITRLWLVDFSAVNLSANSVTTVQKSVTTLQKSVTNWCDWWKNNGI